MPRTYQAQSTSATSSTARLMCDSGARCSRSWSRSPSRPRAEPAGLLAPPDPDGQAEPVAAVGEQADQLGVVLGAAQEVVAGHDPIGRARPAAIALEAGPDERLVGQVVAAEEAGDPLRGTTLSDSGPAVERRLKTAHSTRSASGAAAASRSRASASHQRPGATSSRRRRPDSDSPSPISARRRLDLVRRRVGAGESAADRRWRRPRRSPRRSGARRRAAAAVCGSGLGRRSRSPSGRVVGLAGSVRRSAPDPRLGRSVARRSGSAGVATGQRSRSATSRRSCPARSSPTRISPSSRSADAGSPRALRLSTATSTTVLRTSAAENGRRSNRSGAAEQAGARERCPGRRRRRASASSATLPRVRGAGRQDRAGRHELDAARAPRRRRRRAAPPAGGSPAPTPPRAARDERLGTAVDEEHDPPVAGDRRLDRGERPGEGRGLPAPRRADRRAGQRRERQAGRGLGADRPGRRPVRQRQPLLVRPDRRLAEHEADPAAKPAAVAPSQPRPERRLVADRPRRRRSGDRRRPPSRCPRRAPGGRCRAGPGPRRRARSRAAG